MQTFRDFIYTKLGSIETNETQIKDYSYNVFYAFVKYLYTDSLEIEVEQSIDLWHLANSYSEEELKEQCLQIARNGITIENVCVLYSSALKHNNKELEDICFQFSTNKLNEIGSSDAFRRMDEKHCKSLFIRAANNKRLQSC